MPPGRTNERDPWPSYKIYPSLVAASKRDHTSFILFALDLPRTTQDLVLPSVGLGVCTVVNQFLPQSQTSSTGLNSLKLIN